MKIETKYHGEIELNEKDIWHFEKGIPGFEDEKQFTVLSFEGNEVFFVLQSVNTPSLGFIISNPFSFFKEYEIKLDDAVTHALALEKPEDSMVNVILTVREPFNESTANLQAPLVFNLENKKAKQIILNDYSRKQPVAAAATKE
ncbi:flagellar assembly protein FliW [Jeotgalibacillus haloalkalitolerans]|uniref:Flagellar assembly factor FliW n=1 Tax=Jeotgalibacillus haloalkalitolerans TaxID=3104292 RepID=A0ABU5KK23_9BACL|nr:flagellar assembly protein FliW [Jeotgalibacillus sp. HH7-29]MDZ5711479.1 flagellar assembly protein FliW [Jeotgalibacillus sp. HH7-29]